jgi:hypothetical protein
VARCAGLKHISYTVAGDNPGEPGDHGDTLATIQQIRESNQTLDNRGCKTGRPEAR